MMGLLIGLAGIIVGGLLIAVHFLRAALADYSREVAADALGVEPRELTEREVEEFYRKGHREEA